MYSSQTFAVIDTDPASATYYTEIALITERDTALSPDGRRRYVAQPDGKTVVVFDTATNTAIGYFTTDQNPGASFRSIAVAPMAPFTSPTLMTLGESARLAERARAESWSHEEFLVACLQREVSARESHGGEGRIRAARFPSRKSLEEFDFDHARGLKRDLIAHLGTLDFVVAKDNVVFLGPVGAG
jgi:IstB-like ATP binding protein